MQYLCTTFIASCPLMSVSFSIHLLVTLKSDSSRYSEQYLRLTWSFLLFSFCRDMISQLNQGLHLLLYFIFLSFRAYRTRISMVQPPSDEHKMETYCVIWKLSTYLVSLFLSIWSGMIDAHELQQEVMEKLEEIKEKSYYVKSCNHDII